MASVPGKSDGGSGLAAYLAIKSVAATSLAQCANPALFTSTQATDLPTLTIPKNGTGVFCFQVTLDAGTPAGLAGTTAGITIPIVVKQL
ncbi:hypothetical protein AL755_06220 [Arthrobacter sp. ERGS1:01]|uniref:hypothetical protein n=1 Tax=Arthrobacter sp. ERGS1:01 TaxID=1704044 RepID=UPI0006B4F198|nr:hypothetical protein [Arthrobacter sp. ERGS1:01]ALE05169.1 hypothetical protein AL755_06220 [Arthrobacter sp. ERGS1:01]